MADGSILQTVKKMLRSRGDVYGIRRRTHPHTSIRRSSSRHSSALPCFHIAGPPQRGANGSGEDEFKIEAVKSLIYARVRLDFDPPNNPYVTEAFHKRITELQWRINQEKEFSRAAPFPALRMSLAHHGVKGMKWGYSPFSQEQRLKPDGSQEAGGSQGIISV